MPTYEYACNQCEHQFETMQNMKEDPLTVCSECGGKLRRLISGGTGIIFKGSGFYCNDYGKKEATTKELDTKEKVKAEI